MLPKNYTSRDYARDKAFVDSVRALKWEGLTFTTVTSKEASAVRAKLLHDDGVDNIKGPKGARVSIDYLAKGSDAERFKLAMVFRDRFKTRRARVGAWEVKLEDETNDEAQKPDYSKIVDEICYGNDGLRQMLMYRDEVQNDMGNSENSPRLFDYEKLKGWAADLDARIRLIVENCPQEARELLKSKAGYLMRKYCDF